MVELPNLISKILVPPFQKHLLVDVLQSKCYPVPFEIFTEKTFSLFCLILPVLARDLVHLLKLITGKAYQGM